GKFVRAIPHRECHAHGSRASVIDRDRIVEEDHHSVAGKVLQSSLMRNNHFAHGGVILVKNVHDLFGLGGFRESGETAQVKVNHGEVAAVSFQRIVGCPIND